jgi:hypothetical protein
MNNRGQMVINTPEGPFLREPDGTTIPRRIAGAQTVIGHGVNNLGQMVGRADRDAVIWEVDGTSRILAVPLDNQPGSSAWPTAALAINDHSDVVGQLYSALAVYSIFRLTGQIFFQRTGSVKWGAIAGVSNNGDAIYTQIADNMGSQGSVLVDSNRQIIYAANLMPLFRAISPDGSRLAGNGFLATTCSTSVTPSHASMPLTGGTLQVQVTAESDCEWYSNGLHRGDDHVQVLLAPVPEPGVQRISVAGAEIAIRRGDSDCEYSSPDLSVAIGSSGGTFRMPVVASAGCPWTLNGFDGWARVTPSSGTGPVEVTVEVLPAAVSNSMRQTITLNSGYWSFVTIYQSAGTCNFQIDPPPALGAGSGYGSIRVSTLAGCQWSISTATPWIKTSPLTHFQSGSALFTFEPNTSTNARTALLEINRRVFTISQDGAGPRAPLIVAPSNASGRRAAFRFTYYDGALTSQLSE